LVDDVGSQLRKRYSDTLIQKRSVDRLVNHWGNDKAEMVTMLYNKSQVTAQLTELKSLSRCK
jgi:hypothetical protein